MEGVASGPLHHRVIVLALNVAAFYAAYALATGRLALGSGIDTVWLLCGFALWFFTLLSSPWFIPPRDALANAVTAGLVILTVEIPNTVSFRSQLEILRWAGVAVCMAVATMAVLSLVLHARDTRSAGAKAAFHVVQTFGTGPTLYTIPAVISIIGGYQPKLVVIAWLLILWVVFVTARPIEKIWGTITEWKFDALKRANIHAVGIIERVDHPNIVRARLSSPSSWKPGTLHVGAMSDGDQRYVLALFSQLQGEEVMGTGLCVASVAEPLDMNVGELHATHDAAKAAEFMEVLSGTKGATLVGFTVERSTIGTLRFEVATSSSLAEGDVVFARIGGKDVFYQTLNAETSEESFDQNPRGTYIVQAAQLGCYDPEKGFTKYPWLPEMNAPLFWAKDLKFPPSKLSEDEFIVGHIPSTDIGVVVSLPELVEYHTAVLGVTGTGKTELALDIIREAIPRQTKVFCVDFTGEYRARLTDLNPIFPTPPDAVVSDLEKKLFDAETGAYGAGNEKKALNTALQTMRKDIDGEVAKFLQSNDFKPAVFELSEIANTKATLRLTELYLSSIMAWARKNRKARRILIVLEEAHTIIPETFGAGFDYETQWVVSRIGQIALQGRKYGVGLLVVSQRTALVSKTILSQCNTFFTHCLIDQTSLTFLQSVYSAEHVRPIPNLRFLECLAFGKALRAERPVLIKRDYDKKKKDASDALKKPIMQPAVAAEPQALTG